MIPFCMVEPPTHNKAPQFLKAREAAAFLSYAPDYVTRLAREGKIHGVKEGRRWLIELNSLQRFVAETDAVKQTRRNALRRVRRAERLRQSSDDALLPQWSDQVRVARARVQALAITSVMAVMVLGFYFQSAVTPSMQSALIAESISEWFVTPVLIEQAPRPDAHHPLAQPELQLPQVSPQDGSSLHIAAETKAEVQAVFSDSTVVTFYDSQQGTVTPVFRSRIGTPHGFVVDNPTNTHE